MRHNNVLVMTAAVFMLGLLNCGDDDDSSSVPAGGAAGTGGGSSGSSGSGGSNTGGSSTGATGSGGSSSGGSNAGGSTSGLTPPSGMCQYPGFGACKIQLTCRSYVDPSDEAIKADQKASCEQFGQWFDDGQCPLQDAVGVCWRCDIAPYQAEVAYQPADPAMYKTKCEGIMGTWVDL